MLRRQPPGGGATSEPGQESESRVAVTGSTGVLGGAQGDRETSHRLTFSSNRRMSSRKPKHKTTMSSLNFLWAPTCRLPSRSLSGTGAVWWQFGAAWSLPDARSC